MQIIRNPTGETKLHYKVKKHDETTYPYVIISAGLGENQTADFIRYAKGQPDLELKCKLGSGFTDVVAIELKNPNGSNKTSPEQDAYLERLRGCNVATLVSNNYEDVVIFLHEHYKGVKETHNMLLSIEDQPQAMRIDPRRSDRPYKGYDKASSSRLVGDFSRRRTLPVGATSYRTRMLSSRSASAEAWFPRSCGGSQTSR